MNQTDGSLIKVWKNKAKQNTVLQKLNYNLSGIFVKSRKTKCLPKACSNFCVSVASLDGVGTGKGLDGTKVLMPRSSGLGFDDPESPDSFWFWFWCWAGERSEISCLTRSPRPPPLPRLAVSPLLSGPPGDPSSWTSWKVWPLLSPFTWRKFEFQVKTSSMKIILFLFYSI